MDLDLSGVPTRAPKFVGPGVQPAGLNASPDQSLIVGSDIVSFADGVTAERRAAITDSALLAQLVANKKVPDPAQIDLWYEAYFDVLTHLGWVLQDRGFSEFEASSRQADVAVAILDVAAAIFGGTATAAYAIVKATLDRLQRMYKLSPWITLFERESHHANTARFQVSLAHSAEAGDFLVTLMAFSLQAKSDFSQVLVFKFKEDAATLKHYSAAVSINDHVLAGVAEQVKAKVAAFTQGYIKSLPNLD
jgi:hypothetical protein